MTLHKEPLPSLQASYLQVITQPAKGSQNKVFTETLEQLCMLHAAAVSLAPKSHLAAVAPSKVASRGEQKGEQHRTGEGEEAGSSSGVRVQSEPCQVEEGFRMPYLVKKTEGPYSGHAGSWLAQRVRE